MFSQDNAENAIVCSHKKVVFKFHHGVTGILLKNSIDTDEMYRSFREIMESVTKHHSRTLYITRSCFVCTIYSANMRQLRYAAAFQCCLMKITVPQICCKRYYSHTQCTCLEILKKTLKYDAAALSLKELQK